MMRMIRQRGEEGGRRCAACLASSLSSFFMPSVSSSSPTSLFSCPASSPSFSSSFSSFYLPPIIPASTVSLPSSSSVLCRSTSSTQFRSPPPSFSLSACSFSFASLSRDRKRSKVSLLSSFNATRVVLQGTRHQNLSEHFIYHRPFKKSSMNSSARKTPLTSPLPSSSCKSPSLSSRFESSTMKATLSASSSSEEDGEKEGEMEKKRKGDEHVSSRLRDGKGETGEALSTMRHLPAFSSSSSSSSPVQMSAYSRLRHSLYVLCLKRRSTSILWRSLSTLFFPSLSPQGENVHAPVLVPSSSYQHYTKNISEGEVAVSIQDFREFEKQTEERKSQLVLFSSVFLAIGASIVGLISIVIHWYEEPLIQIKDIPDKKNLPQENPRKNTLSL
ncbi:hypothetical protein CSUI_010145 [Cystoisospora suis]|uniref:Transmembrane protein n=1 Tax=Cystoisospora suis TaxID=483139 RepID=A0A2C6JZK7_9APIC|nr:hypothetical protein CSUI_010145 [Cystoisospora suis]